MTQEQIQTGSNLPKRRGRSQESVELIDAMVGICKEAAPITGRGVGYKLFTAGLIPSMSINDMQRVYRLLKQAREQGTIPWEWIVDETRSLERTSTWADPTAKPQSFQSPWRAGSMSPHGSSRHSSAEAWSRTMSAPTGATVGV